jgi:hypothetical protein
MRLRSLKLELSVWRHGLPDWIDGLTFKENKKWLQKNQS